MFVLANRSVRKVLRCNVQLCEEELMEDKRVDSKNKEGEHKKVSVGFEENNLGENIEKEYVEMKIEG